MTRRLSLFICVSLSLSLWNLFMNLQIGFGSRFRRQLRSQTLENKSKSVPLLRWHEWNVPTKKTKKKTQDGSTCCVSTAAEDYRWGSNPEEDSLYLLKLHRSRTGVCFIWGVTFADPLKYGTIRGGGLFTATWQRWGWWREITGEQAVMTLHLKHCRIRVSGCRFPQVLSGEHFIIKVNCICRALFLTKIQSALQKKMLEVKPMQQQKQQKGG